MSDAATNEELRAALELIRVYAVHFRRRLPGDVDPALAFAFGKIEGAAERGLKGNLDV